MPKYEEINETACKEQEAIYNITEPILNGNAQLELVSHSLILKEVGNQSRIMGISIEVKNVADANIGKAVLNVVFFDAMGNVLDTIEIVIQDFLKGTLRNLRIESTKAVDVDIKSYAVNIQKVNLIPESVATGNDRVTILKHCLREVVGPFNDAERLKRSIDIAIRNISDKTIATAIFEAVFYDLEGNVIDTLRHKEFELRPNTSRAILITPSRKVIDIFKSYKVTLLKMITADIEKIQIRKHERKSFESSEEICGIIKNINDVKTDTVLIANFKNSDDEIIGIKVIAIRDIEPGAIKQFHFIFDTPQGESVKTYSLNIGEITDVIDR